MRIMTFNANGIRAAERKGFFKWFADQDIDVVCIQETKAQTHQLDDDLFCPDGYHCWYCDAEKKGYAGTALFSRVEPKDVSFGLGWESCDSEGRFIRADFDGISICALYMPSGTSGDERQAVKYDFMDRLYDVMAGFRRKRREFVICADWNIAHCEIDLKNWRGNQKNSGFLPDERAWLDHLYDDGGWVDGYRVIHPDTVQYTWWSHRGRAWDNDTGWRLDYQVVTPALTKRIVAADVYTGERFSDHAPMTMEYDWTLAGK